MQGSKLPASIADVAGPIEEAARYERLALERRKGLFGLVSASFLVIAFCWKVVAGQFPDPFTPTGIAFLAILFGLAFGSRAILRRRPGWEPLFERPRGRRFWIRYTVSLVLLCGAVFLGGVLVYKNGSAAAEAGFMAATFAAAGAILAWLAPRHNPVRYSILVGSAVAAVLLFTGLVPPAHDLDLLVGSLALASIAEATYRLVAPSRWLVR